MAFTAPTIWEVRTTGLDTNSGGFDPTLGGTDYTQQDAPQYSVSDLAIDAVTNTKCTSATISFAANHVGNTIIISAGTGFTVQTVQILSVAAGIATCDKALGTVGSTAGTGKLGGGKLTFAYFGTAANIVAGNTIYIASGTYTQTTTRTFLTLGTAVAPIKVIGYPAGGSRTDQDIAEASMPILTSATTSIPLITLNTASYWSFRNIKSTHTAGTRGTGVVNVTAVSLGVTWRNCVWDGCLTAILNSTTSATSITGISLYQCTIRNSTSHALSLGIASSAVYGFNMENCDINTNAGAGIQIITGWLGHLICQNNIFRNNTGANGHGIWNATTTTAMSSGQILLVRNNIFYNNAGAGLKVDWTTARNPVIDVCNNIFCSNGTYGFSCATAGLVDNTHSKIESNAYYNNTTAARLNVRTSGTDQTLTSLPFNNAPGGDFSLNQTASAGALIRQLGWPINIGVNGSGLGVGYPDMGPIQAQNTTGATAGYII